MNVDSRLQEGEDVAGRYRVVRFIAQGGMGEVYEVEDRVLHERIAMKTVRANLAGASAEAQFLREIQLSRSVTHPSVCRIFDVGHHVRASGARMVFLTMELLPGETLRERIRRDRALDLPIALRIVRQIASALTAAHEAGIVHRDLKSANVMLLPFEGSVRAVVTDFGLAHRVAGEETVTASAGIAGTPAYMAPEQVEGTEVTPQTDLYSLGVVMFEMVTGVLPFTGGNALSVAAKRLTTAPPSPRLRRPELPARWERAILACLERDAAKRPRTPRAVVQLLDDESEAPAFESLHKRRPWVRPATAALVVVVAALIGLSALHARHDSLAFLVKQRGLQIDALAVEGEPSGYDVAVRNALRLRLLGRVPLVATQTELRFERAVIRIGVDAPASARAPLRIDGSVRLAAPGKGREIEVTLRIVDPESHRERWSTVQRGVTDQIAGIVARAGDALEAEVGVPRRTASTQRHDDLIERIEELELDNEVTAAEEEAERGLVGDPDSVELLVKVGEAWAAMSSDLYSRVLSDRIATYGSIADPLWQARAAALAAAHDPSQRTRALEAAYALRPHDMKLGIRLAVALVGSERVEDAEQLVARLVHDAPTQQQQVIASQAQIMLFTMEDHAATTMARFEQVAHAAHEAGLRGIELGAVVAGCDATGAEDVLGSKPVCDRAQAMGITMRRPDALLSVGDADAYRQQTRKEASWMDAARKVVRLAEQLGDSTSALLEQSMVARGLDAQGEKALAEAQFLDVLSSARAIGSHFVVIQVLMELGSQALGKPDLPDARRRYSEMAEAARDAGVNAWMHYAMSDIARIDMEEGHPDDARRRIIETRFGTDEDLTAVYHFHSNAALILAELGQDREAAAQIELLRLSRAQTDLGANESSWHAWLAVLAFLRGQPAEMERAAERGVADPRGGSKKDVTLLALYGKALTNGLALSDEELKEVKTSLPWLVGDLEPLLRLALRRARKDDPQALLRDVDAYIAARAPDAVRMRLRGRLERINVLRVLRDPRAIEEARAVREEAHRAGLEAIARTAASLE